MQDEALLGWHEQHLGVGVMRGRGRQCPLDGRAWCWRLREGSAKAEVAWE